MAQTRTMELNEHNRVHGGKMMQMLLDAKEPGLLSVCASNMDKMRMLIRHGASGIDKGAIKRTALHEVIETLEPEAVSYLLSVTSYFDKDELIDIAEDKLYEIEEEIYKRNPRIRRHDRRFYLDELEDGDDSDNVQELFNEHARCRKIIQIISRAN